ncbi:kinase-like domain-containing protein [Rhizophagus irregularis DAOM 181602=DAOM 197198]|nr:kinase-like domain-containing protein [Rhizophagus irregularis DAOM 181602=DAOM 197198]
MDQLDEKKPKHRTCYQCEQVTLGDPFCDTCYSKHCEKAYGRCVECNQINTEKYWCQSCNSKRFQQNFHNWTSEWMPYNMFKNPKYIAEGGFGKVYRASWNSGYILHWDTRCHQWKRRKDGVFVAFKSLNNSQNVSLEFINEVTIYLKVHKYKISDQIIKCHGISQDPNTKDYIMVMNFAKRGNLRNSLNNEKTMLYKKYSKKYKFSNLDLSLWTWRHKIFILKHISYGIGRIHGKDLIHRDLHVGNIVCNNYDLSPRITDMGLCKPANYNESENAKNVIYGVLAYLAPEILRGQNYTKASDIYSFGIIMYEVISGLPPYYDNAHNELLALNICEGSRPEFNIKIPQLVLHIIKSCLDANPSNRPCAKNLSKIFGEWLADFSMYMDGRLELIKTELINQIEETEKINNISSANDSSSINKIHPEAVYKSRPLNFKNLSEPKNSDNYYEIYDNISTKKYSGSLLKSDRSDCLECAIID